MIKTSSFSFAITGIPKSGKSEILSQLENNQAKTPLFILEEIPIGFQLNPKDQHFPKSYEHLVVGEMRYGTKWDGLIFCLDCRSAAEQFFILSQILDLRKPLLIVLTFCDEAKMNGISPRIDHMKAMLSCSVMEFDKSSDGRKITETLEELMAQPKKKEYTHWRPSMALAQAFNILDENWLSEHSSLRSGDRLLEGLRLISDEDAHIEYKNHPGYKNLVEHLLAARDKITQKGDEWARTEALQRAVWSGKMVEMCFEVLENQIDIRQDSWLHRLSRIPETYLYGALIFSALLFVIALILLLK